MSAPRLLGIGECMVELSDAGGGLLRRSFAGDVFNTLWYAAKATPAAENVEFLSCVGTDALSDEMLRFIAGADVGTGHIRRIPSRRPGLYMIHLSGAERSFSYWREHSAARKLAADRDALSRAIDDATAIYFSGITLGILPPDDAAFLVECAARAAGAGRVVAFDPNIRPALWDDPSRMRETIQRAGDVSSIVLPGFDDERGAFGDQTHVATLARYRAPMVVLKDGAGDVFLREGDQAPVRFPTAPVPAPVDTTGAGDSFNGAFLAEYIRSGNVERAIVAGQACAARVICHRGALV